MHRDRAAGAPELYCKCYVAHAGHIAEGFMIAQTVIRRIRFRQSGKETVVQLNFPESTIMPPIDVPWPPRNLVAEITTMSAP
jgi:hypothetical protein